MLPAATPRRARMSERNRLDRMLLVNGLFSSSAGPCCHEIENGAEDTPCLLWLAVAHDQGVELLQLEELWHPPPRNQQRLCIYGPAGCRMGSKHD